MSDHVLIDGDKANFTPSFGEAPVVVQPGTLTASGPATVNGTKVCVAGDEASVSVNACAYTTPSHPIPGTGTLQIESLAGDQTAGKTRSGGTPVLLVGSSFKATFTVKSPAMKPNPPAPPDPDPKQQYKGTGTFTTTNQKFTGV
jgi:Contractile injection system spike tip protein